MLLLQFSKLQNAKMSINLNIKNEFSPLKSVVVGIADDRGNIVHQNNPKISKYLNHGNFPTESELIIQVNNFAQKIEEQGVNVFRPNNIPNQDQIFTRDISFVIDDKIVKSNMKKENRKIELQGIDQVFNQIPEYNILEVPVNATIEGGDVIIHNNYIFVGLSSRTNYYGFEFIKNNFPEFEVIPFQLYVSDNPVSNILHLDCAFQPFGDKYVMLYEDGFIHHPDQIFDIFGEKNIIKVTQFEMYHMNPNIFSINPELIITDKMFERVNKIVNELGIKTIEIDYQKVSRLGGLFRCSTLPLERE